MTAPATTSNKPAPEPTFDALNHEYRLGGRTLVPVSTVLSWGGLKGGFGAGRGGGSNLPAEVGTATHRAIALDISGRLREASVDRRVRPHLDAFRLMREETGLVALNTELMVWSEPMGVAGTLDVLGILKALGAGRWLLDWKTGASADWHAVQTAAYAWLYGDRTLRRAAVYLRDDGSYKLDPYEDHMDFTAWEGAMSVAAWRKHRNLVT